LIILGETPPLSPDVKLSNIPPTPFSPDTLLARYAFSQALSRSTALSALEVSLDDYLAGMSLLPQSLEKTGKPGMSRTQLIKKLGQLMKYRQGLNLNRENFFDTPDYYWDEPVLEGQFSCVVRAALLTINPKATLTP
jgi:required for meiotic nuclear division protein 1